MLVSRRVWYDAISLHAVVAPAKMNMVRTRLMLVSLVRLVDSMMIYR